MCSRLFFQRFAAATTTALLLTGCYSVPNITPDLLRSNAAAVRVQGSRGPLSATQSQAVLDRLKASGTDSGLLERHLAIEEAIVDTPLTAGNRVTLLQDGPATYQAMFAAITAAKDHINMETYILDDDEVGQRFANALLAKQQQGVQVNLIRDSVGTFATPAEFFTRLSDGGINVLEFNPVNPLTAKKDWSVNQRDHRKLLVVDGRIAFLGGINISSVYSGGSFGKRSKARDRDDTPWRDTDIAIEGPVVAEYQKLFLSAWEQQKGKPLAARNYFPQLERKGDLVVRAIGSAPDEPYSQIYVTLLSAIANAEESIQITNAYFVPDPQLLNALVDAAKRGVNVSLILPSQTDSWLVFHAGRASYTPLLKAGVKIFERRGVVLHSKTALVDGVWATVGSTNLDWRSFLHNYEINAVVLGSSFGRQIQTMFDRDLAQSNPITLATWQRRPISDRAKEIFATTWEYWL
jgi:cardiolipin synthase A/B